MNTMQSAASSFFKKMGEKLFSAVLFGGIVAGGIWSAQAFDEPLTAPTAPKEGVESIFQPQTGLISPKVLGLQGVEKASIGPYRTSCALLDTGKINCWGSNSNGVLGDGTLKSYSLAPVEVKDIDNAIDVSTGYYHSCAVLDTGEVKCWGYNNYGQLGNGTTTTSLEPVLVSYINNAVKVTTGDTTNEFSCALLSTGEIKCWGYSGHGELGRGSLTASNIPVLVTGIDNAIDVSCGTYQCFALLSTGKVKAWGYNGHYQLGDGTTTQRTTPVLVKASDGNDLSNITKVKTHGYESFALNESGNLLGWGYGANGNLGNNSTSNLSKATQVKDLESIVIKDFAHSHYLSCAVSENNEMYCWGTSYAPTWRVLDAKYDTHGAWGHSANLMTIQAPMKIPNVTISNIFLGGVENNVSSLSCSITDTAEKELECFGGRNIHGRLGNGTVLAPMVLY